MSRLNIVPDMTHDFLLALSRGEGLSQVRYFCGDFFFVSFIIFPGISSLFLFVGVVSHQVFPDRTSYDFARCRPLPWLFWKTVLRKKNYFRLVF